MCVSALIEEAFFFVDPEAYLLPTHHPLSTLSLFLSSFHPHSLQTSICNRAPQKETQSTHLSFILPLSFPLEHLLSIFLTFIISCYIPTSFVFPSSIPHPPPPQQQSINTASPFFIIEISFSFSIPILIYYSFAFIYPPPLNLFVSCLPPSAPTFKNKTLPSLLTHTHFSPPHT